MSLQQYSYVTPAMYHGATVPKYQDFFAREALRYAKAVSPGLQGIPEIEDFKLFHVLKPH